METLYQTQCTELDAVERRVAETLKGKDTMIMRLRNELDSQRQEFANLENILLQQKRDVGA